MAIKLFCDVCKREIDPLEPVNAFRMWNLAYAQIVVDSIFSEYAYDEDYYLCDDCFGKLFEHLGAVDDEENALERDSRGL